MYNRHPGDDLLKDDPRLKYKWDWSRSASRRSQSEIDKWTHFQVSKCNVGYWVLESIQWGHLTTYYESRIMYGNSIISSAGNDQETGTKTRLDAQIRAEQLLNDWIEKEYKFLMKG